MDTIQVLFIHHARTKPLRRFWAKPKQTKWKTRIVIKRLKKRPLRVTICSSDKMRSSSCHLTRAPSQANKRSTPRSRARPFAVCAARQTFQQTPEQMPQVTARAARVTSHIVPMRSAAIPSVVASALARSFARLVQM